MKLCATSGSCHSRLSRCLKWNGQTKVAAEEKGNSTVISSWTSEQLNLDKSVEFWRKLVPDWVSLLLPCLDLIEPWWAGRFEFPDPSLCEVLLTILPISHQPLTENHTFCLELCPCFAPDPHCRKHTWTHQWVRHTLALNTALHYEEYGHRQVSPFKLRLCPWELYTKSKSNHI